MSNEGLEQKKTTKELLDELPEDRKFILEQFRKDLETSPIRKLNKLERDIYGASIIRAIEYLPSFRDALAVLSPYMDATSQTAYTDKYARVGLSYWFFYVADNDTRAIAILHESMHVLNNHFARGSSKNLKPRMMNISGDLEINSNLSLLPGAKTILQDFLLPDHKSFELPYHKTLEQYSILIQDKLNENENEREKSQQEKENGESGNSSNGESEQSSQDSSDGGDSQDSSQSGNSSEGSGTDSSDGSSESNSGSSQGQEGNGSGSEPGSGYGQAYDSFVDDILDRKKKSGGSSLEDLLSEKENNGKCDGNHANGGNGQQCDGSCDHNSDDGQGESSDDGEGSGDSGKGSAKDAQKGAGNGGRKQRVPKPVRNCDRNTDARSEAADEAGVGRSSVTEQNIARRNTKTRIVDELNNNKSRGSGSANEFLKIVSILMTPPKVDWQELFRRKFNAAFNNAVRGRSHSSYKRIDRRSPGKIIFPGRISFQPKAMMGIDTSGSMAKKDYESVLIEAEGIMSKGLRSKGALQVFSVDTTIKNIEPVKKVKEINLYGGGGTDMSVAFAYVNSIPHKERPNIFVLGTDGGTDWNSIVKQLRSVDATYQAIILVTNKYCFENVPEELHSLAAVLDVSEGNDSW